MSEEWEYNNKDIDQTEQKEKGKGGERKGVLDEEEQLRIE